MTNTPAARFLEDVDAYITRDPATHSRLEVLLCAPGFHALLLHRLANRLHRLGFRLPARIISQIARFLTGVEIHPGARIGRRVFIDHGMGVVIGETAYIGHDVSLYHGVTLGGVSPIGDEKGSLRHPQVGDGVIIGSGAQLLGPIEIGDYARIGSNAVVVHDVAPCMTVVGIPARPVLPKSERERAVTATVADSKSFDAYAVSAERAPDPTQIKIDSLIEELQRLRTRVAQLEEQSDDIVDTAEQWAKAQGN